MNPAPCPERPPAGAAPANSSSPTAAPSSLTRSAPCRWEFQPKLLRAVETHRVTRLGGQQEMELDIRIISSTNRRLGELAASGRFRDDLYYRLNVLRLEIPPLRSRPGDIRVCAERFLARLNGRDPSQAKSMSEDFLEGLLAYGWPGNVRELQNGVERAFYSTPESVLGAQSLPLAVGDAPAPSAEPCRRERGDPRRSHALRRGRGKGRGAPGRQPRHALPPHQALRHRPARLAAVKRDSQRRLRKLI